MLETALIIVIGAGEDPQRQLGLHLAVDDESDHTADVLKTLKLPRDIARIPLIEGSWL